MMVFIIWVLGLLAICKMTRGWGRAALVTLYVVGSVLVAL